MHAAFTTLVDPTGTSGQNIYSRDIATALATHDAVDLTLVCPEPAGDLPAALDSPKVTTRFLPPKEARSIHWHASVQKPMYDALTRAWQDEHIDGIVSPLRPSLVVPPLFARRRSVPQALLVEGMVARNVRELAPFPGATIAASAVATLNARTSDCIFAAYEEAREWISSLPGVPDDRARVFTHGVDTSVLTPEPVDEARNRLGISLPENAVLIGYVGSFKPYHRLDLLVDAVAAMREDGRDARLLLVGVGPERQSLERRCRERRLSDAVTFPGFVEHDEIAQYISACDVLYGVVDPSHWGSPMKVFEYLACGRPTVAYDAPELSFVEEEGFGELIENTSVSAVRQALQAVLERPGVPNNQTGWQAREYISTHRTWNALADRIVDCL